MSINIKIITPNKIVYNELINEVILPTINGEIGILKNHISLLTILNIGVLKIKTDEKWIPLIISKGIAQIKQNQIIILVNNIEKISNLDELSILNELERAINSLKTTSTNGQKIKALNEIKKAQARFDGVKFLNKISNNK